MNKWGGWLIVLTTTSLTVVGLNELILRSPLVPLLRLHSTALRCSTPPVFRSGYQSEPGSVVAAAKGFNLQGNGWVETDVCTPGTLTLKVRGEAGGDALPRLDVTINSQWLQSTDIQPSETLRVNIPQAGRVVIAYLNDYYQADVRLATLENIRLIEAPCHSLRFDVQPESGVKWNALSRSTWLFNSSPITLTPCAPGKLSLQISGRQAKGIFPSLSFKQQGKVLKTAQATDKKELLRIPIGAEPVEVRLINPFTQEIADRNIFIDELTFQVEK